MNALAETFASLGYFERLKEAGVPEPQARVQADALRQQTEAQRAALRQELDRYDEASRRELATKGDALAKLCAMLDIPIAQCMAFGDDTNDCSMLRAAGLGVAMGNASDAVKTCADAVAESNEEDGLARMIEQVLGL